MASRKWVLNLWNPILVFLLQYSPELIISGFVSWEADSEVEINFFVCGEYSQWSQETH